MISSSLSSLQSLIYDLYDIRDNNATMTDTLRENMSARLRSESATHSHQSLEAYGEVELHNKYERKNFNPITLLR